MIQQENFSKAKIGVIASLAFIFIVIVGIIIIIIIEYLCFKISSAVPKGDDDRHYRKD